MPHSFKITAAKGGQFVAKYVYNAETIFWSENYAGKDSAKNAIASLKKNAAGAAVVDTAKGETGKGYRFELAASKDGQTFVRFVASNGETMVKKRPASDSIEATIPTVVRMAIEDATISEPRMTRSTWLRARKRVAMLRMA